jgi:hypothetical protein
LISKKSSMKPLCQMNRNLGGSIYGKSSIKIAHLVPIRYQTILVSDWLISNKIFSSVTPWPNESNLVGSIRERSSIKIAHLVPIR